MHGYVKMGKSKSEIFTVTESVGNWFEVSNHSLFALDGPTEIANRPELGSEALVQANGTEVATNGPEATGCPTGVKGLEPSTEVVRPGGTEVGEGAETPLAIELDESKGSAHQAFCVLLHVAGYECW